MSTVQPNPRTWTLRFKHHRTTVLIHVDPLQKWATIRSDLLRALEQTHPSGQINDHKIPKNTNDILLARPADINDLSRGWVSLDTDHFPDDVTGKGKAKVTAKKPEKGSSSSTRDCPSAVGLKDGSVVAFKFRSESDDTGNIDVDDEDKLDGDTLVGDIDAEQWDVIIPSLEETYDEPELDPDEGVDLEDQ